jgi:hypothetical protein
MIRIYSIQQALSLQGSIPELAVIRSLQFMGDGYIPEEHGHIVVIQEGDDIFEVTEVCPNGLCDEYDFPSYEFVEAYIEKEHIIYEAVYQIDNKPYLPVCSTKNHSLCAGALNE